jgi:predicted molibdopterin-dependent oxidoreductase YjgC
MLRDAGGNQQAVSWHDALVAAAARLSEATPAGTRFLLSAHASHEELFLFRRLAGELGGVDVASSWRVSEKPQPQGTKFVVPIVDAPNVNGARMFGIAAGRTGAAQGTADVAALRTAVESGAVRALYVFDPGPAGSIGDLQWVIDARARGTLAALVVQGVLASDLSRAADVVLPGASFVEKEASYTNDQGRLQGAARAMAPPGDAMEDWRVVADLGRTLGMPLEYPTGDAVRRDIVARHPEIEELRDLAGLAFSRPVGARHWLQASNPSERWKWDFMYQDLPPTKFAGEPFSTNFDAIIPLKEVK